jgi:hypothetical protein
MRSIPTPWNQPTPCCESPAGTHVPQGFLLVDGRQRNNPCLSHLLLKFLTLLGI